MLEDGGDFLEEMFIRYEAAMLRRAEQIVCNVHDAQDVVSDVWISLTWLHRKPRMRYFQ